MITQLSALVLGGIASLTAPAPVAFTPQQDAEPTWHADFDEALKVAKEQNKDLLIDFTGSDWCPPCKKLHSEVLSQEAFLDKASKDFVLVALDFPRSDEAKEKVPNPERNAELMTQYGVRSFPTVLLMTPSEEEYGRMAGYRAGSGPEAFLAKVNEFQKERPASGPIAVGDTVPAGLELTDLTGKEHTMGDFRGKIVVVHFWSDTCPIVKRVAPILTRMNDDYADADDVVMIGINSNSTELGEKPAEDADLAKHYAKLAASVKKSGLTHPMIADRGNVIADRFDAQATPHLYVIDAEGVLQYKGALNDDPQGSKGENATNYADAAVEALRAGKTPKVTDTKAFGCSIKRTEPEGDAAPEKGRAKDEEKGEKKGKGDAKG